MEVGDIKYGPPYTAEWKIADFPRLWKTLKPFRSPEFGAMGAMWYLEIHPDRNVVHEFVGLHLYLVNGFIGLTTVLGDNIFFKVGLKKADGEEFAVYSGNFNQNKNGSRCGKYIYLEKSELIREKRNLAPDDTVTVYCDFQEKEISEPEPYEGKEKHKEENLDEKKQNKEGEKNVFQGTTDFEKLSEDFKDLLLTGENNDMIIKVNNSKFRVHKAILSARSPVFASMFKHDMKEKSSGIVDINDCTADAFYDFLLYLYTGKLEEFSREKIFELHLAADKYDVKQLKSACIKFMAKDLCIDIFCDVLSVALRHEESELLESVLKFFAKNLKSIILTVKWQTFIKENPIEGNELYIKALNSILPD